VKHKVTLVAEFDIDELRPVKRFGRGANGMSWDLMEGIIDGAQHVCEDCDVENCDVQAGTAYAFISSLLPIVARHQLRQEDNSSLTIEVEEIRGDENIPSMFREAFESDN